MGRKFFIIFVLVAFSMILYIQSAFAISEQEDLMGEWSVDIWMTNDLGIETLEHSQLTIDSSGNITEGDFIACSGIYSKITGGHLTINSNGIIEGTIETSHNTVHVETGAIVGIEGQLALKLAED